MPTIEELDHHLLEFLIAYRLWCKTDENLFRFSASEGLCGNIANYQKSLRLYVYDTWALWDHQRTYFPTRNGEPDDYPFGNTRDEGSDFRRNPRRIKWVDEMIARLTDKENA